MQAERASNDKKIATKTQLLWLSDTTLEAHLLIYTVRDRTIWRGDPVRFGIFKIMNKNIISSVLSGYSILLYSYRL